jgi:hypothetical protein
VDLVLGLIQHEAAAIGGSVLLITHQEELAQQIPQRLCARWDRKSCVLEQG